MGWKGISKLCAQQPDGSIVTCFMYIRALLGPALTHLFEGICVFAHHFPLLEDVRFLGNSCYYYYFSYSLNGSVWGALFPSTNIIRTLVLKVFLKYLNFRVSLKDNSLFRKGEMLGRNTGCTVDKRVLFTSLCKCVSHYVNPLTYMPCSPTWLCAP